MKYMQHKYLIKRTIRKKDTLPQFTVESTPPDFQKFTENPGGGGAFYCEFFVKKNISKNYF